MRIKQLNFPTLPYIMSPAESADGSNLCVIGLADTADTSILCMICSADSADGIT